MNLPAGKVRSSLFVAAGIILLAGAGFVVMFWLKEKPNVAGAPRDKEQAVELVKDAAGEWLHPPTIRLSARAARALGVTQATIKTAQTPTHPRTLPPQIGTLAYDNDRLVAVKSRFAGEVFEIKNCPVKQRGTIPMRLLKPDQLNFLSEAWPQDDGPRPFSVGDEVRAGETLAIVWSKDLGDKKAALIDAIIDYRRDSVRLKDLEKLYFEGSVSASSYYEAQRTVKKDLSARNAAERTLRMWKLEPREIEAIKREAQTIDEENRDPEAEKEWARVEVKAPIGGVIVEKNTHLLDWVDPANYGTPMFRVADLTKLQVFLNPSEENLPVLQDFLKKPGAAAAGKRVQLAGEFFLEADPNVPLLNGELIRLAPSLDSTQHTPLLVGSVDNPTGRLLVGQFVTATFYVPVEKGLVEIPTSALNEEKGQSVVFVQRDQAKPEQLEFSLRSVDVVHRFKDVVYVRSTPPPEAAPGALRVEALLPGERVLTESVVELTKALRDLLAKNKLANLQQQN